MEDRCINLTIAGMKIGEPDAPTKNSHIRNKVMIEGSVLRFGAMIASLTILSACAPLETLSDPRYNMVTPTWGDVLSSLGDVVSTSGGEAGEVEVVVLASGETRQAAREEAVRTALQATVSQLVITDRLVEDSEVVKNEIFATQNGFVTGFEILKHGRSDYGEHEIRARVRVAEDTILNYVALQEGTESQVDGASLFAEVRRSSGQRQVLQDMVDRFVSGYPWEVVSLELTKMEPVAGHDDRVSASLTAVSNPDYFISFQQFLERVSVLSYQTSIKFGRLNRRHNVNAFVRSKDGNSHTVPRDRPLQVPRSHASTEFCIAPRPRQREIKFLGTITMDVDQQGRIRARCYLLPPGEYLPGSWETQGSRRNVIQGFGQGNALGLLVSFLDDSGQSMVNPASPNRAGECLLIGYGRRFPGAGAYMTPDSSGSPEKGLPFRAFLQNEHIHGRNQRPSGVPSSVIFSDVDTHLQVVLRTKDVDFSRVTTFRGRPVIAAEANGRPVVMKDPGSPPMAAEELCTELLNQ